MSLLTVKQLAEELNIGERTVWTFLGDGMPAAIRRGAVVRFDIVEVRRWLSESQERRAS